MARMARGKKSMADNEEMPDVGEGRLPPSDLASLAQDVDLDRMSDAELVALIEETLDRLSAGDLKAIRDAAEEKRQAKLEDAKNDLLEEMRAKAEAVGITLNDLFPQSSSTSGRKLRSDAGKELPVKYRGPQGETWSGRGHPPKWLNALEATGNHRDDFLVQPEEQ